VGISFITFLWQQQSRVFDLKLLKTNGYIHFYFQLLKLSADLRGVNAKEVD
jgi:hypothetical protein